MALGLGHPRGPIAWGEAIGLEHVMAVLDGLWAERREERYRPAPLLVRRSATSGIAQARSCAAWSPSPWARPSWPVAPSRAPRVTARCAIATRSSRRSRRPPTSPTAARPSADGNLDLELDLYQPTGDTAAKRPALVWVHGGGFTMGDKSSGAAGRRFARLGWASR